MVPGRRSSFSLRSFAGVVALCAIAVLLLIPAALGDTSPVLWVAPTPADHATFNVKAGKRVIFQMAASTPLAGPIVHIDAGKLPTGVAFNSSDGTTARAKFDWVPEVGGDFTVQFGASTTDATGAK